MAILIIIHIQYNRIVMNTVITAKIRALFLAGGKYTAKQLNAMYGFNDSRKAISMLRANGMKIQDIRMNDGCKQYWFVRDERQLSLFGKGGYNG